MKKYLVAAACLTLISGAVYARKLNKEQKRLEECGVVMQEVLNVPDNIPKELLEKAECVIVIPSVKKLAFGSTGVRIVAPDAAPTMRAPTAKIAILFIS